MSTPTAEPRPTHPVVAALLILFGVVGWIAAFALTVEKFVALEDPDAALSCDFSVLVQCSTNLASQQGAVLGFPNPILGLGGFVAPIAVGVGLLAGARFARWFWIAFQLGVTGAIAFVVWLIGQSVFVLGTLCPWCMVVWTVTIPLFLVTTFDNLRAGRLGGGERVRRAGGALLSWTAPIAIACYLVVALLAQARLDVLARI